MSVFRTFLTGRYRADPSGSARFLSDACVLIRVQRRYWWGRRKMSSAKVLDGDSPVSETATTKPSWKLCPPLVTAEFEALGLQVDALLARYTLTHKLSTQEIEEEEEHAGPSLVGRGTYAVDASVWPTLQQKLYKLQEAYTEAADRWCSEDGYERMLEALKEELGASGFDQVKPNLPPLSALRKKYGLRVVRASVEFVPAKAGDAEAQDDLICMLETAIRGPREEAADAWTDLAGSLVNADGTAFTPPDKVNKAGKTRKGARNVVGRSVAAAYRVGQTLATKANRYLDRDLRLAVDTLSAEFSEDKAVSSEIAKRLNSRDDEAARIGKMLLAAAALARSETSMCEGFKVARGID